MPQDPSLYGQRPNKKQKKDATLLSSLDFTAQLTSLMSNSSSTQMAGRSRPSKSSKNDLFKSRPRQEKVADERQGNDGDKLVLKETVRTEEETRQLAQSRRKMENKARLYAAMKRGDYVPKDNEAAPLVDFDRKWAEEVEGKESYSTDEDSEVSDSGPGKTETAADDEIIEYEDEFGRLRKGTRADREKQERRLRRGLLGAEEVERMSARPSAPQQLIYGDTIQSMAFAPEDEEQMETLAAKRDRSATPPETKHYDADWEVRTKGTGFYKFSKDEAEREQEMAALEEERRKTEGERQAREEERRKRKEEIEGRRREMRERRAKKQADSFLDGL